MSGTRRVSDFRNIQEDIPIAWNTVTNISCDCSAVIGLFLSNENTVGPAIDLLALVLREASRDRR